MDFNTNQLIDLVKCSPQIYDASRSDFKIPDRKDKAWTSIARTLKTSGI